MKKTQFITIEGIEGAGKTTCMKVVSACIKKRGYSLLETREPGGTDLGEDLRALLLGHKHTGMADDTELMLMFASRAEHIARKIRPSLEAGEWVLCDRFTDATYAYQGGGRELDISRIEQLEQWVQADLRPNLTILMDLSVEIGLDRAGKRSTPDRFESEAMTFFQRVRTAYLAIAAAQPNRVKIVDASQDLVDVEASIEKVINEFIDEA